MDDGIGEKLDSRYQTRQAGRRHWGCLDESGNRRRQNAEKGRVMEKSHDLEFSWRQSRRERKVEAQEVGK